MNAYSIYLTLWKPWMTWIWTPVPSPMHIDTPVLCRKLQVPWVRIFPHCLIDLSHSPVVSQVKSNRVGVKQGNELYKNWRGQRQVKSSTQCLVGPNWAFLVGLRSIWIKTVLEEGCEILLWGQWEDGLEPETLLFFPDEVPLQNSWGFLPAGNAPESVNVGFPRINFCETDRPGVIYYWSCEKCVFECLTKRRRWTHKTKYSVTLVLLPAPSMLQSCDVQKISDFAGSALSLSSVWSWLASPSHFLRSPSVTLFPCYFTAQSSSPGHIERQYKDSFSHHSYISFLTGN